MAMFGLIIVWIFFKDYLNVGLFFNSLSITLLVLVLPISTTRFISSWF